MHNERCSGFAHSTMKSLLPWLLLLTLSPGAYATTRCDEGGRTWYQDIPCPAGASTTFIPSAPTLQAPLSSSGKVIDLPQQPSAPLAPPPAHIPQSVYEQEARICLAWYQKEMQLQPDTRYLDFTKDQRVLTITIPVRASIVNPFGIVTESTYNKQAACEIHGGRLDDSWTRIHAKRGGWIQ